MTDPDSLAAEIGKGIAAVLIRKTLDQLLGEEPAPISLADLIPSGVDPERVIDIGEIAIGLFYFASPPISSRITDEMRGEVFDACRMTLVHNPTKFGFGGQTPDVLADRIEKRFSEYDDVRSNAPDHEVAMHPMHYVATAILRKALGVDFHCIITSLKAYTLFKNFSIAVAGALDEAKRTPAQGDPVPRELHDQKKRKKGCLWWTGVIIGCWFIASCIWELGKLKSDLDHRRKPDERSTYDPTDYRNGSTDASPRREIRDTTEPVDAAMPASQASGQEPDSRNDETRETSPNTMPVVREDKIRHSVPGYYRIHTGKPGTHKYKIIHWDGREVRFVGWTDR